MFKIIANNLVPLKMNFLYSVCFYKTGHAMHKTLLPAFFSLKIKQLCIWINKHYGSFLHLYHLPNTERTVFSNNKTHLINFNNNFRITTKLSRSNYWISPFTPLYPHLSKRMVSLVQSINQHGHIIITQSL